MLLNIRTWEYSRYQESFGFSTYKCFGKFGGSDAFHMDRRREGQDSGSLLVDGRFLCLSCSLFAPAKSKVCLNWTDLKISHNVPLR
jgi:hypothetical protein